MTKSATQKIARQVEDAVEEVGQDLRKASRRISHEAEKTVTRAMAKFGDGAREVAAEARHRGRAVAETTTETVRAHPLKSVAILAGVAALIGYAFGRGLRPKR